MRTSSGRSADSSRTTRVEGIDVAGVRDILAMKLKVIRERGELRDYFDLMAIEQQGGLTVEEGLALFLARYRARPDSGTLGPIVRALGHLDDVDEDEALPLQKADIAAYWRRRQPEVASTLGRFACRQAPDH